MQKTRVQTTKPSRRPTKSATGAAVNAPKKVPADRIDTISDCCSDVISGKLSFLFV